MKIKLIFTFFVFIFLVSFVSSIEFDNRLSYEENEKILTVIDNFGFGGDLIKIQLIENTYICGIECSTTWNVSVIQSEDVFLTDLVFEQVRGVGGVSEHKFEVISDYKTITVNDYGTDCTKRDELNQCKRIIIGTHEEQIPIWSAFNPERKLPIGNYVIKLTGKKQFHDTIDWVASYSGKRFNNWAFWASTPPSAYYRFNEADGATEAIDDLGLKNLTVTDLPVSGFAPGKLANAFNATTTQGVIVLNTTGGDQFAFGTNDFTIAFWLNGTKGGGFNLMRVHTPGLNDNGWSISRKDNTKMEFVANNTAIFTTTPDTWNNISNRIVYVRSGTGSNQFRVYVNNDNTDNVTLATDILNNTNNFTIHGALDYIQIDDLQIYNNFAWSVADVEFDWNNGAGREANVTTPEITVNLISPGNGTDTSSSTVVFNATGIPIDANLTNATIRIFNTSTNLFDSESIDVIGNVTNESIFTISDFTLGTYFWNVEFCGVANNITGSTICSRGVSNFTFLVSAIINQSVNFSQTTIEGSTENFILNLTFNSSSFNLDSATFNYNNTLNTSIIAGTGNNRIITSSIIIPNVTADVNQTFFWNLSFTNIITSGGSFESTTLTNQTVLNIGLDSCTSFTNRILNFTVQDEELQTFIADATIETAINLFDVTRTVLVANVSGNFTNPATFCLNINLTNTTIYSLDVIARYELPLQFANEYFNIVNFSLTINSTVQDIILFDLNISDSTEFQLTFTGSNFLPVENALVFVDRQYIAENVFKTVELPKTDSNGQTILHLVRNDVVYNIRISKDGTILGSFENLVAFCEDFAIEDCKIDLNAGAGTEALFNYDTELGITFTGPNYNNDTRIITFDFLTSDGSAKTVLMNVTRSDIFGNRTVCEDSLLSSGGTLSCTIPSSIDDADLIINVFVNGQQSIFKVIRLDLTDFGVAGYLVLFVMSLSLILMFSASKTGILLAVLLSFAGAIGLGLITSNLLGVGASGLWLIIIVLIGIYKLNKDRIQ